ncbi:hypothetical protein Tco_1195294 [Tanacetum coccineum]
MEKDLTNLNFLNSDYLDDLPTKCPMMRREGTSALTAVSEGVRSANLEDAQVNDNFEGSESLYSSLEDCRIQGSGLN